MRESKPRYYCIQNPFLGTLLQKHTVTESMIQSYIESNDEVFNSYLGISYSVHIDQTLIKFIYINMSQFLKMYKLMLYSKQCSHSFLLSMDLTLKWHIQDPHRIQKPSLCSRTHVGNMRLGPPVILYSSAPCLPIATSTPISKSFCHFMIAVSGTSRD